MSLSFFIIILFHQYFFHFFFLLFHFSSFLSLQFLVKFLSTILPSFIQYFSFLFFILNLITCNCLHQPLHLAAHSIFSLSHTHCQEIHTLHSLTHLKCQLIYLYILLFPSHYSLKIFASFATKHFWVLAFCSGATKDVIFELSKHLWKVQFKSLNWNCVLYFAFLEMEILLNTEH